MGKDVLFCGFSFNNGSWIFLVYLNMVFLIWILLYVVLELRVISEVKLVLMVFIIWFRDGNFDVKRGIWFYFNICYSGISGERMI